MECEKVCVIRCIRGSNNIYQIYQRMCERVCEKGVCVRCV